jgi:hypothetical protein
MGGRGQVSATADDVSGMARENLFWHGYVTAHPGHHVLSFDPGSAFAVTVCLFVLACWAAAQIQSRCGECASVPARCRCARDR